MRQRSIALIILDGWGYREETQYNAIYAANTPNWDKFWSHYPHTLLVGSGKEVGLPLGQMGNSEVGHLHMGAGRLVPQDLMRINEAIQNGNFFENELLLEVLAKIKKDQRNLHILGLLSSGGVHSYIDHITAMVRFAARQKVENVYVHAILDGRDTPPRLASTFISALEDECKVLKKGRIVSLIGRYYAMDRDQRWERTQVAYDLYLLAEAKFHAHSASEGLALAYDRNESDEFVQATLICPPNSAPVQMMEGDAVVFMNFRADRMRQLVRALTCRDFSHFKRRTRLKSANFVTLTHYAADIKSDIAYPPLRITHSLGEYVSEFGLTQLRIAETEKYAHVTFFLNGGGEVPFKGEDRILIPSPKIATYDLKPEMSARELTEQLINQILSQKYDLIICNFANADMVGHSGNMSATIEAVEVIDECLGKIVSALQSVGGEAIITADHGNAELMFDVKHAQPHTAHTENLVPLLYIGRKAKICHHKGSLIDIAPTLLYLLNLPQPIEMTGHSLLSIS
jgi:2,3-bisphosphoglycerate-independent phosphoglycerate mutase